MTLTKESLLCSCNSNSIFLNFQSWTPGVNFIKHFLLVFDIWTNLAEE